MACILHMIGSLFFIVLLAVQVPFWAYIGYMKFVYTPPPPIPCSDGMTLMRGQTCYGAIVIGNQMRGGAIFVH